MTHGRTDQERRGSGIRAALIVNGRCHAAAVLGAVLSACSLTGIGEYDIAPCDDNRLCERLNRAHGITDESCEVYQCREDKSGCELRERDLDGDGYIAAQCNPKAAKRDCDDDDAKRHPGAKERCDGQDDNCDGVIDDGVWAEVKERGESSAPVADGRVSYAADIEGQELTLASWSGGAAHVSAIPGEARGPLEYGYQLVLDAAGPAVSDLCPESSDPSVPGTVCSFDEVVATRVGDEWVVASVNTEGCAQGQLRVGHLDDDVLDLHGPESLSNVFLGVGRGAGRCTGDYRADGVLGFTQLAIAGMRPSTFAPQALVVGLADAHGRDACATDTVAVEALGLALETASFDPQLKWVSGTGDGVPLPLGMTRASEAPVVIAHEDQTDGGYLIFYPAVDGGVSAHFLAPVPTPPGHALGSAESRQTAQLEILGSETLFGDETVGSLAVNVVPGRSGRLSLGFAWTDEKCATSSELHFATAELDLRRARFSAIAAWKVATVDGGVRGAPTLAQGKAPLISDEDSAAASDADRSGWTIAWETSERDVYALRVVGTDGRVLGGPTPVLSKASRPTLVGAELLQTANTPRLAALVDGQAVVLYEFCGR